MVEFRERVGVRVNDEVRWGVVIEKYNTGLASAPGGLGFDVSDQPHVVRVWIDGEPQPMQDMVPSSKLVRW